MAVWDIKERNDIVRANEIRGSRGFFMGGTTPGAVSDIYQIDITSTGNAVDFGGNLQGEQNGAGKGCNAGSAVRIIYGGGSTAPAAPANGASTQISYFTPIHSGNAADFGNLTLRRTSLVSLSNNTRALFGGGYDYAGAPASSGTNKNIIDFITIQSLGNAVDFGDLQQAKQNNASVASTTRGVWAGGHTGSTINQIDFVTIASAGDAADFGDLSAVSESFAGSGNNIIGIVGGGNQGPYNGMDKITIASTGGGTDFGDLTQARRDLGSTSNQIRQVFAGGAAPGLSDIIDFLQIASLGDCADFGDLVAATRGISGSSVSHGGLELGFFQRPSVTYMPGSGRGFTNAGTNSGGSGGSIDRIQLTHIPTLGNAIDFGNAVARQLVGGVSSLTRTVIMGGEDPDAVIDTIDSFEHSSLGNTADFGNLSAVRRNMSGGGGNSTRGVFAGGNTPSLVDIIEYITFASAGNATDFGNITTATEGVATCSGGTRTVHGGGYAGGEVNTIEYTTTASTGNATDFGDLTDARRTTPASSPVRAVFMGGYSPGRINIIDYITIASTGDAADFGDLTAARSAGSGLSNSIRAIHSGGEISGGDTVNQDYITIATTGDAADFGDLVEASQYHSGTSDSHGGLQG